MVGMCGVLGERDHEIDRMGDDLRWTGEEDVAAYEDENVALRSSYHPGTEREQPASTRNDALVWVWGNVWGYDGPDGYVSRRETDSETIAQFCARRYEADGIEFAAGLNGTFAAAIYDREDGTAYLLTDRLGTHSIYYARPRPETLVFSTHMQSLPLYPAIETGFDVEYLSEYFALGCIGGTKTPLTGIEELSPSSVTTVDLDDEAVETEQYWRPRFEPLDRPFSYFAERFTERFEAALDDRLNPDLTYGLLLSGGSDSRAILAGIDTNIDLRTYHATNWLSRETRTAERAAFVADRDFQLLMRDRDNHKRLLETVPRTMNFQGRFRDAHVDDFADRLRDEVDVLISGLFGDSLFRDHSFPTPDVRLGPLGTVELPFVGPTDSIDDYVAYRATELPEYLDAPSRLEDILERNIETENGIVNHGIEHRSVEELFLFHEFYPVSGDGDFFYRSLNGMMPHWTPFFDNRLVDLALRLPMKHRTRRSVIDATTATLDESLAALPHAKTGVPLTQSFPTDFLWQYANWFVWEHLQSDDPPRPYLTHDPWVDGNELLREHDFAAEKLREKEDLIDALPFLDRDGVHRCYRDHQNGANNHYELYTLLSFLEMPVVERLTEDGQQLAQ